jgi:death on curing protein
LIRELTLEQVEHLAHYFAQKLMEWDEPIPNFSTRYSGRLESCLKNPQQTFNGKDLYPTLEEKAAILFYLLIKNHPFQNGNKRIAVFSLLVYLHINKRWMGIPEEELYDLAIWVARSPAKAKAGTLLALKEIIRKYQLKSSSK